MSTTIHKFDVPNEPGEFSLWLPADAEPLCVQKQHGNPRIWVRLDPDSPNFWHSFEVVGTGHSCAPDSRYLGTFQELDGSLVWHVFHGGVRR